MDTLRSKLIEKGIEQNKRLQRALDQLVYLVKYQEGTPLKEIDFNMGMLRLEKRTIFSFASKLY